ncbi:MAG: methionine synthase, partial [Promethearchaeia archaeon]
APDAIAVADMYLCGIIAKKLGVKHFVAQYMFNTPPNISFDMDLAKMLAKNELLHSLEDNSFKIIKQVRTGLASFPLNLNKAKGQLASATLIQLLLKPDIIHIVSFSEASHAALPEDIIESCDIVDQVVQRMYSSNISFKNEHIEKRKQSLIQQAKWIVNLIPKLTKHPSEKRDPWINPNILYRLVKLGIFDAPHLKNNPFGKGEIKTRIINGACDSIGITNKPINEIERIKQILNKLENFDFDDPIIKELKKLEAIN